MKKPRILIASSTEALTVARSIQNDLKHDANVKLWNQGVFGLGKGIIESLFEELERTDYAIIIFQGDDETTSRGTKQTSVRDNVLFELGLFMGYLGHDRIFLIYDTHKYPHIASDISGINFTTYDGKNINTPSTMTAPACFDIRQAIAKHSNEYKENLVYVLMPYESPESSAIFATIDESCKSLGLNIENVDSIITAESMIEAIKNKILEAEFIICDLTEASVNVYFELGYAYGIGNVAENTFLIAKRGTLPPSNISSYKIHYYDSPEDLTQKIAERFSILVSNSRKVEE